MFLHLFTAILEWQNTRSPHLAQKKGLTPLYQTYAYVLCCHYGVYHDFH